jgi:hypothetical protein
MKRNFKRARIVIKQEKLSYDNSNNLAINDFSTLHAVKKETNADIKANLDILNQTRVRPKRKATTQTQHNDYNYKYKDDSDYKDDDEDEIEDEDEEEDKDEYQEEEEEIEDEEDEGDEEDEEDEGDEEDSNDNEFSDIDKEIAIKSEALNATSLNGMFVNLLLTEF